MKFWAIDEGDLDSTSLVLEQRQQPSLRTSDRIVLFKNSGGDLLFTASGVVTSTSWKPPERLNELGIFRAVTEVQNRFREARNLFAFRFTLERVSDFGSPSKNFSGKYTQLVQKDFDAILNARIYWSRTAFALYYRAMPRIVKEAFYSDLQKENVRMLVETDYADLWQAMKTFLRRRLFSTLEMLNAIEGDVGKLRLAELEWGDLAVSTDETASSSSVILATKQRQLDAFVATILDGRGEFLFDSLDLKVQNENESQFSQKIRRGLWHQTLT